MDISIVRFVQRWTVKAKNIAIEFVITQLSPLLLKSMMSGFEMFPGVISRET
jgi:hypothetical protein